MGNNSSRQPQPNNGPCGECNCESEVPRVIAACNKAGNLAVSNTIEQTVSSLLGKENADFIMKEYTSAISNNRNNKWVNDYEKIRESFIEGNDGECVPCDCTQAANEIINECNGSTKEIPSAINTIIKDGNTNESTTEFVSPIMNEITDNKPTNSTWKTIFYPSIKVEQSKSYKEGFIEGNEGLSQVTRDALDSRYAAFKTTATFDVNCSLNAIETIRVFIAKEKNMLDSLYNYYLAFIKDYKSLYLHRESFSKVIYNKLDELEKIQTKIDSYKTNLHIDNRKNLYQSNNYDFYSNSRFYILLVYYSILALYLIFSKFLSEKQYTNKLLMFLLILYLILPIILEYLINLAFEGYIYFLEYNNLKEDTKSYEDIIK